MDNSLLHASVNLPADKYLAESDDERYNKSDAANTFDQSCGGGGSSSSLSAITFYVLATYNVVCCLIFTSYRFLSNDPQSSDDMVD